jgi:hypothetical protein
MKTLLVAAAVVIAMLIPAAQGSSTNDAKIVVRAVLREQIELGPGVDSYRFQILDRHGVPLGYQVFTCFAESLKFALHQCNGTISLPQGKLNTGGTRTSNDWFSFTVVGGNGTYLGTMGSLTETRVTLTRWNLFVSLTP